ncbi:DUF2264 domain-containing protein [Brotaphodocola sp.]|uniref:DUF2264 domain-containing protein n=1 Tax=Brotaphodocola sp. TaxID=3073577 RepID=UPI003D7DD0B3
MTRQEVAEWMIGMLPENMSFLKKSGASYDAEIRYLEAVLRPLWGIFPLVCSDRLSEEEKQTAMQNQKVRDALERFLRLVRERKLPRITRARRQIVVETGVLSYGLGIFRERFRELFDEQDFAYLIEWMRTVNQTELPENNWLFFRVLLNTALKVNGLDYDEEIRTRDLEHIESWYLGDGWYSDGATRQMDYYIAFGFHYYGLLYARMETDEYAKRFRKRAEIFSGDFLYWFDKTGKSIPFGRSLTYRFAHVCFWSGMVMAENGKAVVYDGLTLGKIKGLICRNLAYWQNQPIDQNGQSAHPMNVGYGYSNLLLSEDYNAPGSPFWSFKTFAVLELSERDEFWMCEEESYPQEKQEALRLNQGCAGILGLAEENADHHVMLSCGACSGNPLMYHAQEKYGKFAYSTYFGFNLTREFRHIRQFAIDNALAIAPEGTGQYLSREKIEEFHVFEEYGVSRWNLPFAQVCTYLIPLDTNTHVRIHEVKCEQKVEMYEGGFPVFGWNPKFEIAQPVLNGVILQNESGYSEIRDLLGNREAEAIPQGPNTNLYSCEPNGVPALKMNAECQTVVLACMVRGIPYARRENLPEEFLRSVSLEREADGWLLRYGAKTIKVLRM